MMRCIAGYLGLLCLLVSSAAADEKSKGALIEEMLTLNHVEKMFADVLDQQKNALAQQSSMMLKQAGQMDPESLKKLTALVDEYQGKIFTAIAGTLAWNQIKPEMVKIYGSTFSEEELAAIVAFHKTPAGRALAQKMPGLMKQSGDLGQRRMQTALPELQRLSQEMSAKARAITQKK